MIGIWLGRTIRSKAAEARKSYEELFEILRMKFSIIDEDSICCRYPLEIIGAKREMQIVINRVKSLIKPYNIVITPRPGCYKMLRTYLPSYVIKHTTEFLIRYRRDIKKLLKPLNIIVTYHDPCDLTRYLKHIRGIENVDKDDSRY